MSTRKRKPLRTPDVQRTDVSIGYEYAARLLREIDEAVTAGLAAQGQHRGGECVYAIPKPVDTLSDIAFRVSQLRNQLEHARREAQ